MEKRASNVISMIFMREIYNEYVHHWHLASICRHLKGMYQLGQEYWQV